MDVTTQHRTGLTADCPGGRRVGCGGGWCFLSDASHPSNAFAGQVGLMVFLLIGLIIPADAGDQPDGTGAGRMSLEELFKPPPRAVLADAPPFRPVPRGGPETRTLLVYTEPYRAYSLEAVVENVSLALGRVVTRLETVSIDQVESNQVERADYLVMVFPRMQDDLPDWFWSALMRTNRPVLWVGFGMDQLTTRGPLAGVAHVPREERLLFGSAVQYRGSRWSVPSSIWSPIIPEPEASSALTILMAVPQTGEVPLRPVSWRLGHFTCFAGIPSTGPAGALFADMILDFYQVGETAPPTLYLRIEDYHPLSRHARFQRMVDFLHARRIPFLVGVTPSIRNAATGRVEGLDTQPAFARSLRYAQQRGGRIVLRGCLGDETTEFWDSRRDRPRDVAITNYTRECLEQQCQRLLRHGVLPLAWETPSHRASQSVYATVARTFSSAVEQVQLSDATQEARFIPAGLTRDRHGRLIVGDNLGYVTLDREEPMSGLVARAARLLKLRGAVLGCSVHAYASFGTLVDLVEQLEALNVPFMDLVELDHWVHWPGGVLLTGKAKRSASITEGPVRWRAYDEAGRLVGESVMRSLFSGQRVFERRGLGVVEIFEAVERER